MKLSYVALVATCLSLTAADNQITKIFFHRISHLNQDQNKKLVPSIELAKLVLYFDKEPVMTSLPPLLPGVNALVQEISYFFAHTQMSSEAQTMISGHKNSPEKSFRFKFESVNKPAAGLKLNIQYDPQFVAIDHSTFTTIGGQKAIAFTFYNKQLITALQQRPDAVLHLAQNHQPTVVIDYGHGGHDTGAKGFYDLVEKELTFAVGSQLTALLEQQGWQVVLTRTDDTFVALDERTKIANQALADCLISLHANYAPSAQAHGLETFYYDAKLMKNECYFDGIISLAKNMSHNLSKLSNLLADAVHRELLAHLKDDRVTDRSVKSGTPQVLMGAGIPAVLIEMGFVSNKQEAAQLKDPAYQQRLVHGIYAGLQRYFDQLIL